MTTTTATAGSNLSTYNPSKGGAHKMNLLETVQARLFRVFIMEKNVEKWGPLKQGKLVVTIILTLVLKFYLNYNNSMKRHH